MHINEDEGIYFHQSTYSLLSINKLFVDSVKVQLQMHLIGTNICLFSLKIQLHSKQKQRSSVRNIQLSAIIHENILCVENMKNSKINIVLRLARSIWVEQTYSFISFWDNLGMTKSHCIMLLILIKGMESNLKCN